MKVKNVFLLFIAAGMFFACKQTEKEKVMDNPLLSTYETPFEVPPFDEIKVEHYVPAFEEGIKRQSEIIEQIVSSREEPDFENTIVAYAQSDQLLTNVSKVFFNILSAHSNKEMEEIAKEVSPMLSAHNDNIKLNKALFKKIKSVYDNLNSLDLKDEQRMLLKECYESFVRGGALLEGTKANRFRQINEELSKLTLQFGQNLLSETNNFKLIIDDKADLTGLPEGVIASGAEAAREAGMEGKWVYTLHKPSMIPFIQYAENRELRKEIYSGYFNRCNNNNEYDNKDILKKITNLRIERAQLLGFESHSDYVLAKRMSGKSENVYNLLDQIWEPAIRMAKSEAQAMQEMIDAEGKNFNLESWDWWYYAEKIRKEKYDLDEEEIRPYFGLENVKQGVFTVANKLFGLTFEERPEIPVYHPDVTAYEVKEADGSHRGILYMDFHPRTSKRGGAWMTHYRHQMGKGTGEYTYPVISIVCNFSKPTGDTPALLTFDEVSTLFHEFGHALHGLLSDVQYRALAGTSVPRDFVELPSQIMENWAAHPDVMKMYARHYETGETIPDELIEKIEKSGHFNQGFATVEYLAASYLDMSYHTLSEVEDFNVLAFEDEALAQIGLIPEIISRYRSTYFNHIFRSGYSSGYYSYIWSEVMDADAFEAFKENGIYDKETAASFREHILSKGGTVEAEKMYLNFRGKEPKIEPLLEKRGLNKVKM